MSYWASHVPGDRKPFHATYIFTAADTVAQTLLAGQTGVRIYVQHIQISITTSAAQSITVRDDTATPVPIAALAASSSVGPHEWWFGPDGIPCTLSEGLEIVATAGNAAAVSVHGYTKRPGPVTESASKSTW
jgi:hypothetical protein